MRTPRAGQTVWRFRAALVRPGGVKEIRMYRFA